MHNSCILFSSYLPPIQYFSKLISYEKVYIDIQEHYVKQTYRNRCTILTAHEVHALTVPILHTHKEHVKMKDVKISYDQPWQQLHWKTLESAYRSSPFFEYYEDRLLPFYQKPIDYLVDFNTSFLVLISGFLKLERDLVYTEEYHKEYPESDDYRNVIHPKTSKSVIDPAFIPQPYLQVFPKDSTFVPNLSIIDLLCNKGPESMDYIKMSLKFKV